MWKVETFLTIVEDICGRLKLKALVPSNLQTEGDFAIVISWVSKKERGPWKSNEPTS